MSRKRILPPTFICKGCSCLVTRKPAPHKDQRRDYCSPSCKVKAFFHAAAVSACETCQQPTSSCAAKYCEACRPAALRRTRSRIEVSCLVCAAMFSKKPSSLVLTCGRSCAYALRGQRMTGKKLRPYVLAQAVRPCVDCGVDVQSVRPKRCTACRRKAEGNNNHCERAKRKGAPRDYSVTSVKVFERDGWRCQLCGTATPKRLRGKQLPNSPEVDHIVPIAAGGGHTWDNVQCACRQCNGAKGAKPLGQLRIPGGMSIPTVSRVPNHLGPSLAQGRFKTIRGDTWAV